MYNFPKTNKKLKSRISDYKSSLLKEKKRYGGINDGQGKRYLLFALYFVLDDRGETRNYIEWYEKEFADDVGEPIQKLCWALSLRRMNNETEAKKMLAETMLSNLYIIPKLLGEEIEEHDIWHPSNYAHSGYVDNMPREVIACITEAEMQWMRQEHASPELLRIRRRYIEIYRKLKDTREISARRRLVDESSSLLDSLEAESK